jgi:hypothetical protein
MTPATFYVTAVFVAIALFFVVIALRTYVRYRGVRVVTCPETAKPAVVSVDAGHAAISATWERPDLKLQDCSRWPERGQCAQPCLKQIAAAPEDCLMRNLLARWFAGKTCAFCDKPVVLTAHGQQPGLRDANGSTYDFVAIPPEKLIADLDQYAPVCFDCHIAEQFRREYPQLVTEKYENTVH